MADCSNTCQRTPVKIESPRVTEAAETLACLLTDTIEFQTFLRLSRAVRLDQEVNQILSQLNGYADIREDSLSNNELENRLESLPLVQEYRRAESQVRELFTAVETTVSTAAGVSFAENAHSCGGT